MDRTCAFATLGCKVNQCDTQSLQAIMEKAGYTTVDFSQRADVYIINTCSVTAIGEKKSRQMIHRAHRANPDAVIAVTGCYAQRAAEEVLQIEGVSMVIGNAHRSQLAQLIEEARKQKKNCVTDIGLEKVYEELTDGENTDRTRAFIKIQDGCDRYCTYCIIPYLRGRVRSRDMDAILAQVDELAKKGFMEIVLNGIHLSSYGRDFEQDTTLADVVERIAEQDHIKRIRLGSLEPCIITENFVERIAKQEKLCPNFHLSLQSGSDTVLRRMNRRYTTDEYRQAVALLRKAYPFAAISTDIIVGFPGETEEEFAQTIAFVKEIGFAWVHIFAYSRRAGTKAADMPEQLSHKEKQQRAETLSHVCDEQGRLYRSRFIGQKMEVLCETFEEGLQKGLTGEHLQIEFSAKLQMQNTFVNIIAEGLTENGLYGKAEEM